MEKNNVTEKKARKILGFRINSISVKFVLPITIVIFLSIVVVGIIGYLIQRDSLINMMYQITETQVNQIKGLIDNRQNTMQLNRNVMNNYLISITKGVARYIEEIPEDELNYKLDELAKDIGVFEINVSNENGILMWSNVAQSQGFDFNSSEESRQFIQALNNKDFELAQSPTRKEGDKILLQYIGVARQDKPGIVQIGVKLNEVQELLRQTDMLTVSKTVKFGKGGYVTILNNNGIIISHSDDNLIGTDLKTLEWGKRVVNEGKGGFTFDENGKKMLISFDRYNDKLIICSIIPTQEYLKSTGDYIINDAISFIILLFIAKLLILFIVNKYIIKRVNKLLAINKKVSQGKLYVKINDKNDDEIGELFDGYNEMTNNLKNIVLNITKTSNDINKVSSVLAESSEQVSSAGQQIASSINEIANGANNQVEEIHNGINELRNLTSSIDDINNSVYQIKEQADNISNQNKAGLKTVDVLKTKFNENKSATANVNEKINILSERSSQIENITESITSIASQTSLLALNASIEAARAGEAGKGFAVVAEEIRSLAEDSSKAANNINNIINLIKQEVASAVLSMKEASDVVIQVDGEIVNTITVFNILKESNDIIVNLISNLNEIGRKLNENKDIVISSMDSIVSVSEETAASTEQISATTQEQAATYQEIHSTAAQLKLISDELTSLITVFETDKKN